MIKAVLFDADGVVILPGRFADYLERELHLTRLATQDFFNGAFLECLVGRADLKQVITPFLQRWGWKASAAKFLERWFEEENVVDQRMIQAITDLRRQGLVCGLATNQEKYRLEYIRVQMGFSTLFDAIFCSADIGAMKHAEQFYEQVTRRLGLPTSSILFWDDSQGNVDVARASGWNAEQYTDFESFQRALQGYLRRS